MIKFETNFPCYRQYIMLPPLINLLYKKEKKPINRCKTIINTKIDFLYSVDIKIKLKKILSFFFEEKS